MPEPQDDVKSQTLRLKKLIQGYELDCGVSQRKFIYKILAATGLAKHANRMPERRTMSDDKLEFDKAGSRS